jgi:DNA invertase Pin-like site-specific DNA recombinase
MLVSRLSTKISTFSLMPFGPRDANASFPIAQSGARTDRPGLREALAFAREGDILAVWKWGQTLRVSRPPHRNRTRIGKAEYRVPVVFPIFAALASVERSLIQERTRAGLAAARLRGRVRGRPKLLTAEKLAAATKLLASGTPPRDVATILSTDVIASSLKRTGDPRSDPPRQARELFNLGLHRRLRKERAWSFGASGK